jgi:hypothetical protein
MQGGTAAERGLVRAYVRVCVVTVVRGAHEHMHAACN